MEVMEAIQKRYSARGFEDRPVEDEKLKLITEAARLAPTARNEQLNKHIVVTDKELIRRLMAEACLGRKWIETAPVMLVECASGDRKMLCGQSARSIDGAIALSFMMLEAVSLGLQGVWLGKFEADKVKEILNIPEDHVVIALAPIGYPAAEKADRPKKPLEEVVIYNRMD